MLEAEDIELTAKGRMRLCGAAGRGSSAITAAVAELRRAGGLTGTQARALIRLGAAARKETFEPDIAHQELVRAGFTKRQAEALIGHAVTLWAEETLRA
jgi:hypothetical protein